MPTCYALRHVPFESLGLLEPILVECGYSVCMIDVPVSALPSAVQDAELLVVLGGPIGAYEERHYPFLTDELRLLESRLRRGKATLGICLGAQLIARALGARVYPGKDKEIGWTPVTLTPDGESSALAAIREQRVLHWHGDTFDLPSGAKLLASTEVTPHQAFLWQQSAAGLQFHLEVPLVDLEAWYVGHATELAHWARATIPELRGDGLVFAPRLEAHARAALRQLLAHLTTPTPNP